ncbi:MAG TPA: hypothetical protein DGT53_01380 [Dialister sp.]|nr:hypothetical protein [Dialister sp.]
MPHENLHPCNCHCCPFFFRHAKKSLKRAPKYGKYLLTSHFLPREGKIERPDSLITHFADKDVSI